MLLFAVISETLFSITLLTLFISAPVVCVVLFFYPAPYGRYEIKGRGMPARSAWFWMELPAVFVLLLFFIGTTRRTVESSILLLLWEVHYVYRTFIYPQLMRDRSKRRFPVYIAVTAFLFNCINGYANGYHLFSSRNVYPSAWFLDVRFILGALLFVIGLLLHIESDRTLRNLRREGESSYSIPRGGMFELISAPNYLGEIIEWIGWAIASWSLPGLAFALFTVANLLPRAVSHHKWYRRTFDDYPENRKAIIPFVL